MPIDFECEQLSNDVQIRAPSLTNGIGLVQNATEHLEIQPLECDIRVIIEAVELVLTDFDCSYVINDKDMI